MFSENTVLLSRDEKLPLNKPTNDEIQKQQQN